MQCWILSFHSYSHRYHWDLFADNLISRCVPCAEIFSFRNFRYFTNNQPDLAPLPIFCPDRVLGHFLILCLPQILFQLVSARFYLLMLEFQKDGTTNQIWLWHYNWLLKILLLMILHDACFGGNYEEKIILVLGLFILRCVFWRISDHD